MLVIFIFLMKSHFSTALAFSRLPEASFSSSCTVPTKNKRCKPDTQKISKPKMEQSFCLNSKPWVFPILKKTFPVMSAICVWALFRQEWNLEKKNKIWAIFCFFSVACSHICSAWRCGSGSCTSCSGSHQAGCWGGSPGHGVGSTWRQISWVKNQREHERSSSLLK